MKTRAELEELLATQRARRVGRPDPVSRLRASGRNLFSALGIIVILIASGAAMFFAVQLTTSKIESTGTSSPSVSPTSTKITPTLMAAPIAMRVCTDIPDGRLHVRFSSGDGSEVRGYLAEGEAVQIALDPAGAPDSQTIRSELWLNILSPVEGWVNARYLCKSE